MYLFQRRQWQPTPVLLPEESHGQRSLVGCSPWGRWGSGTTEQLHFHFSLSCTGEGNGNPLQCSCLENPRDGGAWWAAVYGVAQSRTRPKWLSSSIPQRLNLRPHEARRKNKNTDSETVKGRAVQFHPSIHPFTQGLDTCWVSICFLPSVHSAWFPWRQNESCMSW